MHRAKRIVANMTLSEKIMLVHGNVSDWYTGWVHGVERLGIPELRMQDGPQGFRTYAQDDGTSTQWPSGMTVAMSWDTELMYSWGQAMAQEFRGKGANVLFGPAVNLHRIPQGGRNFEYISGEDPYLGYKLVQPLVRGIQETGVIANIKHLINNEHEGHLESGAILGNRHVASSEVDERTQVEMYFMPFIGAVEAGVLSAMCGNNIVNGVHACEDNFTQNTMLREKFGFKGFILSDYRGAQHTIGSALGGLDLQTPGCPHPDESDPTGLRCTRDSQRPNIFGKPLQDAVLNGTVPVAALDEKVTRLVYAMVVSGVLDRASDQSAGGVQVRSNVTNVQHKMFARNLARRGAVLLKNHGGLLPLFTGSVRAQKVVVIGAAARDKPITGGGGSGAVAPAFTSTVFDALRERLGQSADIVYDRGEDANHSAKLAAAADLAIIVIGSNSREGVDRGTLTLAGDEVVPAVAAVQNRTVVLAASPGTFTAPWVDSVRALLGIWYSGQEQGHAAVELLFGDYSPSGKLIFTIPNSANEMAMPVESYPGVELPMTNCTIGFESCYALKYNERLEVGYRWYNAHDVKPKFPFGHGLTYSTWELDRFTVSQRKVAVNIRNTGSFAARQVVQLYITYPATAQEPPRQLRDFLVVGLHPGKERAISFKLGDRALSIWDNSTHSWALIPGTFSVEIGFSSEDLRFKGFVNISTRE